MLDIVAANSQKNFYELKIYNESDSELLSEDLESSSNHNKALAAKWHLSATQFRTVKFSIGNYFNQNCSKLPLNMAAAEMDLCFHVPDDSFDGGATPELTLMRPKTPRFCPEMKTRRGFSTS